MSEHKLFDIASELEDPTLSYQQSIYLSKGIIEKPQNGNFNYTVGEKIIVIERTHTNEVFEWEGEVIQVTDAFVETKHCRNGVTHPQWHNYWKAYSDTFTKHYGLDNIKKIK